MLPYWFLRLTYCLKPRTTNTPFFLLRIIPYVIVSSIVSRLVGEKRLELLPLARPVPKTGVSTNSTIRPDTLFDGLIVDIFYFFNFLLELCPIIEETGATAGVEPPFVLSFFFFALYFSRLSIAVSNISSVL